MLIYKGNTLWYYEYTPLRSRQQTVLWIGYFVMKPSVQWNEETAYRGYNTTFRFLSDLSHTTSKPTSQSNRMLQNRPVLEQFVALYPQTGNHTRPDQTRPSTKYKYADRQKSHVPQLCLKWATAGHSVETRQLQYVLLKKNTKWTRNNERTPTHTYNEPPEFMKEFR